MIDLLCSSNAFHILQDWPEVFWISIVIVIGVACNMIWTFWRSRARYIARTREMADHLEAEREALVSRYSSLRRKFNELTENSRTYEILKRMSNDRLPAVSAIALKRARKESKDAFWQGIIVNAVFFLLGVFSSIIIEMAVR